MRAVAGSAVRIPKNVDCVAFINGGRYGRTIDPKASLGFEAKAPRREYAPGGDADRHTTRQLETSRNRAVSSARVAWGCSGGGFAGEEEGWAAGGSG
jgi:hypothetical protein